MPPIKAIYRNGRVELEGPVDLPEGTHLTVIPSVFPNEAEDIWDDSPEGIQDWLKWLHSLEPFILTDEDRAAIEKARKEDREWELAHADERDEKLRSMWK